MRIYCRDFVIFARCYSLCDKQTRHIVLNIIIHNFQHKKYVCQINASSEQLRLIQFCLGIGPDLDCDWVKLGKCQVNWFWVWPQYCNWSFNGIVMVFDLFLTWHWSCVCLGLHLGLCLYFGFYLDLDHVLLSVMVLVFCPGLVLGQLRTGLVCSGVDLGLGSGLCLIQVFV